MPKRPEQHVLENKCRLAIKVALPAEWVVEDLDEDYRRDMEVEIVADGELTGVSFAIQAKGTGERRPSKAMTVRGIPHSHIEHWHDRRQPVLVVLYLESSDQLFGYWAHEQGFRDGTNPPLDSPRFSFDPGDALTEERIALLELDVERYMHTRTGRAQAPARIVYRGARATSALIASLAKRFREDVGLRVKWVNDDVLYPGDVALRISNDRIGIDVGGGMGATLHIDGPEPDLDEELIFNALLMLLMKAYTDTRGYRFATTCAEQVVARRVDLVFRFEFAQALVESSLESGRFDLVLDLARGMLGADPASATLLAVVASRSVPRGELSEQVVEVARTSVELQMGPAKATASYNLSNILAAAGRYQEALEASSHAAEWDPDCLDRGYWWKERASILFNAGYFKQSLEHYMRALDFADEIDDEAAARIMYLAGDAALRSSDLETASKLAERSHELLPTTIGSLLGAACRVAADDPELLEDDVWEWLLARASRGRPSVDEVLAALFMRSGDDRLVAAALTAVASAGDPPEPMLDLFHLVQYCAKNTDLYLSQLLAAQFDTIDLVVGPLDRGSILEQVMIVEAQLDDDLEPFELRIHNLPEQFGAGEGRASDEEAG